MDGQVSQKLVSPSLGDSHSCKEREMMLLFFLPQRLSREKRAHVITVCTSLSPFLCFFRSAPPSSSRAHLSCFVRSLDTYEGQEREGKGGQTKEVKN